MQVMASTPDIVQAQRSCRSFLDQYKDCRGGQLPTHPLISCLKLLMLVGAQLIHHGEPSCMLHVLVSASFL